MLLGCALFQGQHYIHQIELILKFVGSPSREDLQYVHNERARMYLHKKPKCKKIDFTAFFPGCKHRELDLLDRCLTFNPQNRYDVYQCISHPYVSEYHDDEDEPIYFKRFQINEDVDEDLPRDVLIELIHKEVAKFKSNCS
uniref:Mitogen-activated protein kinase mpk-1 (Trinotate prediction) n=1 Tax=Myxobolus squamalis TaxID=59785 RepID=A0A6B2GDH1_MYXSQ